MVITQPQQQEISTSNAKNQDIHLPMCINEIKGRTSIIGNLK